MRDRLVKINDLSQLLYIKKKSTDSPNYILIIKDSDHRLAIPIDDVIKESDIVIKPLPRHFKDIKFIMGVTVNN